jgi:hypothetical protein
VIDFAVKSWIFNGAPPMRPTPAHERKVFGSQDVPPRYILGYAAETIYKVMFIYEQRLVVMQGHSTLNVNLRRTDATASQDDETIQPIPRR